MHCSASTLKCDQETFVITACLLKVLEEYNIKGVGRVNGQSAWKSLMSVSSALLILFSKRQTPQVLALAA